MRRDCLHLFPLISMLLFVSTLSNGQAWSGVLAPSRAIDWSNAGLPATLPDGETTPNPWTPPTRTVCTAYSGSPSPITGTGAGPTDIANISNALSACASQHGTYIPVTGTFSISGTNNCFNAFPCIPLYAQSGLTLRGTSPQTAKILVPGNARVQFGVANGTGMCQWSSGYSAGTTSIGLTSCNIPPIVGQLLFLGQCDTGYNGYTGNLSTLCTRGTSSDNGGLYICGLLLTCATESGGTTFDEQEQNVYITSVTNTGGSNYTVTFSPGLYMPNWSSANSPYATWTTNVGNGPIAYGNALEDLTLDSTAGNSAGDVVSLQLTYASWLKGVRMIGISSNNFIGIQNTKNSLLVNNYMFGDLLSTAGYGILIQQGLNSDELMINNILTGGDPWEGTGATEGNVLAFNYSRDSISCNGGYFNRLYQHSAGSAFMLYEGNQAGQVEDDDTHGTHDLNTWFRNYASGWDPPYQGCGGIVGAEFDSFSRFENAIGNSFGSALITNYQSVPGSSANNAVFKISASSNDPLTVSSLMRWGNCDTATSSCRFQTSEVPSSLPSPNASLSNPVPDTTTLPASFFMNGVTAHANGGTGLSWWKVCKIWTTFPTSCASTQTQPFPVAGPDVTGGPYVNGTAYDIPAEVAFMNLPIDPAYQNSYSVTGSNWSGGTETITVSGLPQPDHLMGGFQLIGVNSACNPSGNELFMTNSSSTTVSYALASNPGVNCTGTMKFPDVRQFDERVYQNDSGSGSPPPNAPTGLAASVQ
jgi:hypothetical protein